MKMKKENKYDTTRTSQILTEFQNYVARIWKLLRHLAKSHAEGLGPAAANDDDAPPPTPVGPTGDPLNP